MRVTPRMAGGPATVTITVTVAPNETNRILVIENDSSAYYRSSAVQLDGKQAARTHVIRFRGVPPGEYTVTASIHGTEGVRAVVRTPVTVVGSGIAWP